MSNDPALSELICNFVYTTIVWHESQYYKMITDSTRNINLESLKNTNEMKGLIAFSITKNMNNIYKDLLTNTSQNQKVSIMFKEMSEVSGCSTLCLLNLVYSSLLSTHKKLKREHLVINTQDEYVKSISDQLIVLINDLASIIQPRVCKGCIGDLSTCDPNKPLFSLENTLTLMMQ